uniref:MIP17184p n=1 Tax=Drosophila melanogaster TaxID=7227 RepID=D3DMU4_DROME|nr:MIP17184p [Drosophila melanogaster]
MRKSPACPTQCSLTRWSPTPWSRIRSRESLLVHGGYLRIVYRY